MPTRKSEKVVSLKDIKVACQECSLNEICLPVGVESDDLQRLDEIIDRKRPIARGDHLFRGGDAFQSLYALRSGSLITARLALEEGTSSGPRPTTSSAA